MIHSRQGKSVTLWLTRRNRRRTFKTLPISAAENVHGNGKLVASHFRLTGNLVGIYVDHFDYPIRIAAGGGGEQIGDRRARNADGRSEQGRLIDQYVGPVGHGALIRNQPGSPAVAVGESDGTGQ